LRLRLECSVSWELEGEIRDLACRLPSSSHQIVLTHLSFPLFLGRCLDLDLIELTQLLLFIALFLVFLITKEGELLGQIVWVGRVILMFFLHGIEPDIELLFLELNAIDHFFKLDGLMAVDIRLPVGR
jgi:hypothetical protein